MAAQSTLRNMVLCLTLVCLVCAAILGGMYALTYEPIQKANENILKASIGAVLPEGVEIGEVASGEADGMTFEYYPAAQGGEVAAYAVKSTSIGFGGPLSLMVGVLKDGTVYNTSVLSCTETPGLGAKCQEAASHFRTQFQGFGPDKSLKVTKDGGDVDAITASTITSRAYALAVSNAVAFVRSLAGEAVDTSTGASTAGEKKGEE